MLDVPDLRARCLALERIEQLAQPGLALRHRQFSQVLAAGKQEIECVEEQPVLSARRQRRLQS